jgi:hypothetical protein
LYAVAVSEEDSTVFSGIVARDVVTVTISDAALAMEEVAGTVKGRGKF